MKYLANPLNIFRKDGGFYAVFILFGILSFIFIVAIWILAMIMNSFWWILLFPIFIILFIATKQILEEDSIFNFEPQHPAVYNFSYRDDWRKAMIEIDRLQKTVEIQKKFKNVKEL